MAIKLPAFLTSDTVKKVLTEVGILSASGLICTLGSYIVVTRVLKPTVAPAVASAPVTSASHGAEVTGTPAGEPAAATPDAPTSHSTAAASAEHDSSSSEKDSDHKKPEKESKGHDGKAKAGESKDVDTHLALKPVIVNLMDPSARRYAKMTLTLDLTNEKIKESISQREPEVYDALIKILGNYRFEEINTSTGKEALKEEIKSRLNLLLKNGVASVYLTEMIVQ